MFFEMPQFTRAVDKAVETFDKIIGNNISTGGKYHQIKLMMNKALSEKEPYRFETTQEARLGFAVLSLESNMTERVLQANRFMDFIETAMKASDRLAKPMLGFYYHKYSSLENSSQKIYITESLKLLLRNYTGRNPMILKAKQEPLISSGSLYALLDKYGNVDIKDIKKDLYLSEEDEFYQRLRLIKLLEEVQKLNMGENNPSLFQQIYEARDVAATNTRNMGEESVAILLTKCKNENAEITSEWINFILKVVGDPRSPQTQYAWDRIGLDLKNWLISTLSQGDLIEFLGSITDGQGDEIYQYRKAFWMQFVKYVKHAKIMVSTDGLMMLRRSNPAMYERFNLNPTTYSKLDEKERSCIYMDFGSIKVIEGTHNATVRIYRECPIELSHRKYSYKDFTSAYALDGFVHSNSSKYTWQNKMLNYINDKLHTKIRLKDILLPEDTKRILFIQDGLMSNGHRVDK